MELQLCVGGLALVWGVASSRVVMRLRATATASSAANGLRRQGWSISAPPKNGKGPGMETGYNINDFR
jgi:hypothetical protein